MTDYKRLLELTKSCPASEVSDEWIGAAHAAVPELVRELEDYMDAAAAEASERRRAHAELDRLRLENDELKSHIELLTYIEADLRAALEDK